MRDGSRRISEFLEAIMRQYCRLRPRSLVTCISKFAWAATTLFSLAADRVLAFVITEKFSKLSSSLPVKNSRQHPFSSTCSGLRDLYRAFGQAMRHGYCLERLSHGPSSQQQRCGDNYRRDQFRDSSGLRPSLNTWPATTPTSQRLHPQTRTHLYPTGLLDPINRPTN